MITYWRLVGRNKWVNLQLGALLRLSHLLVQIFYFYFYCEDDFIWSVARSGIDVSSWSVSEWYWDHGQILVPFWLKIWPTCLIKFLVPSLSHPLFIWREISLIPLWFTRVGSDSDFSVWGCSFAVIVFMYLFVLVDLKLPLIRADPARGQIIQQIKFLHFHLIQIRRLRSLQHFIWIRSADRTVCNIFI